MSEQTSPLHDPSSALAASASGRSLPRPSLGALTRDRATLLAAVALFAILAFGGYLRLTHNNWDSPGPGAQSGHLHPDERFITDIGINTKAPSSVANYFDTETSALNPYNIVRDGTQTQSTFVYGTLPLFLNKMLAANTSTLTFGQIDDYDNYDHYNRSGRVLSGLFDVGTIVFVFLIGGLLLHRNVGLLAAFLYASSPFPIQNSHFFVVDPFVTFFATATVYFALRSARFGGWRNFALAGASAGLGAACKITAISLVPVVLLAVGVHTWPAFKPYLAPLWYGQSRTYDDAKDGRALDRAVGTLILGSLVALAAAFLAFRIAMPYAFNTPSVGDLFNWRSGHLLGLPLAYPDIMNQHWIQDQVNQERLLSGGAFPPNVQWIARSKWLWPMQQMVAWGMGPALGITAWLGVAFTAAYAFARRQGVWLVPLAWVLGYFGYVGAQFSLYMRYFLPLYPTLTVFAAVLLYQTWRWATSPEPFAALGQLGRRIAPAQTAVSYAARAGVAAVTVMSLLAGLAFYNGVYGSRVTRAEASEWFYKNVPAGSIVGQEHWDDQVPFGVPGVQSREYGVVTFENFNQDTPERVQQLLAQIEEVDHISLSSRRLSGTIPRVPAVWPVTSRYYAALESGELGFEKVAEFTSYPSIFGIEFDDTGAEESYSVYDHPKVTIYKKTDEYSAERAREALHADAFIEGLGLVPAEAGENGALFRPDVLAAQKAGGTWSDIFSPSNVVNDYPLFFWLLAMEIAAFALVPIAIVVFRGLPDRGFLLTKPFGILALSYAAYAPATTGLTDFTRPWIAAGLGAMILAGTAAFVAWRDEIVGWVRERWRFLLFAEALFLLAFVAAYWVRLQNPDLWHGSRGGEKPMDLAYFIAAVRTTDLTQGVIDPWHAGGYLNYYYFGQFIAATVTKLTGVVPEVAYNLVVPMFFALAAAATFSLTYNLAEATRRLMRRRPDGVPISIAGPFVAGVGSVFLVLVAGNLKAVDVLQQNFSRVSPWHSDIPLVGGIVVIAGGFREALFGNASFRDLVYSYDWWGPSRALTAGRGEVSPITEFPFWTFLFADLHAHLMSIPFAMLAAGVGLGAVLNYSRVSTASARTREVSSWAMVVMLALIVGALRWINSWDYPPFLILGAAALLIGERAKEGRLNLRALAVGGLKSFVMLALTFVFFAPFDANYSQAYAGFHQSDQTTALADYLSHFGILLGLIAGFVLFQLYRAVSRDGLLRAMFFGFTTRVEAARATLVIAALVLGGVAVTWAGTRVQPWDFWFIDLNPTLGEGVTGFALAGFLGIALVVWRELRHPSPGAPILLFVYGMIALGLGLSGGVEILTLDGDIGRMNTVFKFYLHVWMLWGVSAAFGLWYVFGVMRPHTAFLRRAGALNEMLVRAPRYAFAAVAVVLLALTLVYPYFGTRARVHDRFNPAQGTGNNGMDYMETAVYIDNEPRTGLGGETAFGSDRDGINWMRANVQGTPTIIEGHAPLYHFGNRVSIYTGLPGVLGWDWHQSQQRVKFASTVQARLNDINVFYGGEDTQQARDILRRYDVEWVIVGDVERNYYSAEGIAKFNDGLDGRLELAYSNEGMQIWHVIPADELQAASATAP